MLRSIVDMDLTSIVESDDEQVLPDPPELVKPNGRTFPFLEAEQLDLPVQTPANHETSAP